MRILLVVASGLVFAAIVACPSAAPAPSPDGQTPPTTTAPVTTPPDGAPTGATGDTAASVAPPGKPGKHEPAHHRAKAEACSAAKVQGDVEARAGTKAGDTPDWGRPGNCKKDADCTAGKNGRCAMAGGGRLPPAPRCIYDACYQDSDCGPKSECECGGAPNNGHECVAGNCATDADCPSVGQGAGGYCSPTYGHCGSYGGTVGNFCHTAQDECSDDTDCQGQPYGYCAWSPEAAKWKCSYGHCVG